MSLASARGWGPGWPNCQRSKLVTIRAGGVTMIVRKEIGFLIEYGLTTAVRRGYDLDNVRDDWSFACRAIRGKNIPSNHSWGLAIDLNATKNPMGYRLVTDMPRWLIDMWAALGFSWGGNYRTRPDAMHFEFLGTVADAKRLTERFMGMAATPLPVVPPKPPEFELKRTLKYVKTKHMVGDDVFTLKFLLSYTGHAQWFGNQSPKDQKTFGWGTAGAVVQFKKDYNWLLKYGESDKRALPINSNVGPKVFEAVEDIARMKTLKAA